MAGLSVKPSPCGRRPHARRSLVDCWFFGEADPGKVEVGVCVFTTTWTVITPSAVFQFPVIPALRTAHIIHRLLERLLPRVDHLATAIAFSFPRSVLKLLDHAKTSCCPRRGAGGPFYRLCSARASAPPRLL